MMARRKIHICFIVIAIFVASAAVRVFAHEELTNPGHVAAFEAGDSLLHIHEERTDPSGKIHYPKVFLFHPGGTMIDDGSAIGQAGGGLWNDENENGIMDAGETPAVCGVGNRSITANIITCIQEILDITSEIYLRTVVNNTGDIVAAVFSFALIFLGFKILLGQTQIQRETVMFILKVLVIIGFATNGDVLVNYRGYVVNGSVAVANVIAGATDTGLAGDANVLFPGNPPCSYTAFANGSIPSSAVGEINDTADSTLTNTAVWDTLDCQLFQLFGLDQNLESINMGGLAIVGGGLLLAGPVGFLITMMFLMFIFVIAKTLVQAMLLFVVAIFAITFLAGLAPIILPLMLFAWTKDIVVKWFRHILVYSLQPIILFAFMVMAFGLINMIIYEIGPYYIDDHPNDPLDQIMGLDAMLENPEDVNETTVFVSNEHQVDLNLNDADMTDEERDFWEAVRENGGQVPDDYEPPASYGATGTEIQAWYDDLGGVLGDTVSSIFGGIQRLTINVKDYIGQWHGFIAVHLMAVILFVTLVSFMKRMPGIVNRMVGEGTFESIAAYATRASNAPMEAAHTGVGIAASGGAAAARRLAGRGGKGGGKDSPTGKDAGKGAGGKGGAAAMGMAVARKGMEMANTMNDQMKSQFRDGAGGGNSNLSKTKSTIGDAANKMKKTGQAAARGAVHGMAEGGPKRAIVEGAKSGTKEALRQGAKDGIPDAKKGSGGDKSGKPKGGGDTGRELKQEMGGKKQEKQHHELGQQQGQRKEQSQEQQQEKGQEQEMGY